MKEDKRIVDINGVMLEIDLRTAKTVESYKVGDNVKVLVERYGNEFNSYPGIIIGFDDFQKLPTILIAYLDARGSTAEIKFECFNSKTEKIEICPANYNEMPFEKSTVLDMLNREILAAEQNVIDLKNKKEYFENNFNKYFKRNEMLLEQLKES
jgi:ribosomal protein L19